MRVLGSHLLVISQAKGEIGMLLGEKKSHFFLKLTSDNSKSCEEDSKTLESITFLMPAVTSEA